MQTPILATKLHIPTRRPRLVERSRLLERLHAGVHRKLTLVSAPAGFGKTTLVTDWLQQTDRPVAWLSLDEGDNDPVRFMTYVIAAIETIVPSFGQPLLNALQAPQPPAVDTLLIPLINELAALPDPIILVLDDYHVIDAPETGAAFAQIVEHLPSQVHLVMTTREDPPLPLARYRTRGHLTEIRADDLRFTTSEAITFMHQAMGLNLSEESIAALDTRTEGWVAGLQLAALSMQGETDTDGFIASFTGNHRYVLDYLLEEVLHHQTDTIQRFLLITSVLDRLCGPLCDVLLDDEADGQATLEHLEQANLFVIPLDTERRWYRYHHLFADLLRVHLRQSQPEDAVTRIHIKASRWFEANNLEAEALHHAMAAGDIARIQRLIQGGGTPLFLRGMASDIHHWLQTLPLDVLDAAPQLWVTYAWVLYVTHRNHHIEDKLQKAENALPNEAEGDLIGQIAAMRAMLAAHAYDTDTMLNEANRAIDLLNPSNLHMRTAVKRVLALALYFNGNYPAALAAYKELIQLCEETDNGVMLLLATTGLGLVQEGLGHLITAAETYHRVLALVGEPVQPVACAAYLGLARIHYQWNNLGKAEEYTARSIRLARPIEGIDVAAQGEILLTRITWALGDMETANQLASHAMTTIRQQGHDKQEPRLVLLQIEMALSQGAVQTAKHLLQHMPSEHSAISRARVALAEGEAQIALEILQGYEHTLMQKGWQPSLVPLYILIAIAHYEIGDDDQALSVLGRVLLQAEPQGYIRLFLDQPSIIVDLLTVAMQRGIHPVYCRTLLDAFESDQQTAPQPLVDPLSERELEVLTLIAEGLTNREIADTLYIALSTVKGHNQRIYEKLQVSRRTEAVARAQELNLL